MKLTKSQRRKIYLEVAQDLENDIGKRFLCGALMIKSGNSWIGSEDMEVFVLFPELQLFEPEHDWERRGVYGWWGYMGTQPRIYACLLMAEMCKP